MNRIFADFSPKRAGFSKDILSSLVVFLVALPLCMGIAVASGVPPAAGLITGIIGGLVVGFIAGSPLQVSGPAAGLTVIVYEIVHTHGIGMLGTVVLLAGALQIAAGLLKAGQWFRAISPAVIHGMLAGIGVLIIVSQLHVMVDDKPKGSGIANILSIPDAIWKGVTPLDGSTHHLAAYVGLATITAMIAWGFVPKRLQMIPASLIGVLVGTAAVAIFQLPIQLIVLPDNLINAIQWPTLAALGRAFESPILTAAVTLAVVASAETMLTATAVDNMHQGQRTDYDRELVAQGVGNALCGVLSALPMTGVIVRSSANVQAGATTRLSTILHGVWILLFVAALPFVLAFIPTTALAALLVFTGFKLLNPKTVLKLRQYGWSEVAIYLATVVAIVSTNLLEGILIGVGLAIAKQFYTLSHLKVNLQVAGPMRADMYLDGAATFVALPKLAASLERVPTGAALHVHVADLRYIDHACLELLANWEQRHASTGGSLEMEWEELQRKFDSHRPGALHAPDQRPRPAHEVGV